MVNRAQYAFPTQCYSTSKYNQPTDNLKNRFMTAAKPQFINKLPLNNLDSITFRPIAPKLKEQFVDQYDLYLQ